MITCSLNNYSSTHTVSQYQKCMFLWTYMYTLRLRDTVSHEKFMKQHFYLICVIRAQKKLPHVVVAPCSSDSAMLVRHCSLQCCCLIWPTQCHPARGNGCLGVAVHLLSASGTSLRFVCLYTPNYGSIDLYRFCIGWTTKAHLYLSG